MVVDSVTILVAELRKGSAGLMRFQTWARNETLRLSNCEEPARQT